VVPLVVEAGCGAIAVDLPIEDPDRGLADYAKAVAEQAAGAPGVRVVTHSMSAFIAPMVARLIDVRAIILVAPMVPVPGEAAHQWMTNAGQREAARRFAIQEGRDPDAPFSIAEFYLHDLPADIVEEYPRHTRNQATRPFHEPWPLTSWPATPTRCIVGRHDRLYPCEFQRRVVFERLGLVPEVIDSGHLCALSAPGELAALLLLDQS
jgi:pimeloyl-ACP methyl ester carboxylesterase